MLTRRIRPPTIAVENGEQAVACHAARDLQSVWKKSYLGTQVSGRNDKSSRYLLEEVTLRMFTMYAPPVVGKDIEHAQDDDQKGCGPLGFETDSDHDACGKTEERDEYTTYTPFALKNESKEQENEQDTSSKEETREEVRGTRASPRTRHTISFDRSRL